MNAGYDGWSEAVFVFMSVVLGEKAPSLLLHQMIITVHGCIYLFIYRLVTARWNTSTQMFKFQFNKPSNPSSHFCCYGSHGRTACPRWYHSFLYSNATSAHLWDIPKQLWCSGIFWAFLGLRAFLSFLLYIVQHLATRGRSELLSDFWRPIF